MSVKLKKERIKLSEVVCSRTCQTTSEHDIIVPDIKPDVLKVLRTSVETAITQKTVQTDKVYLQGVLRFNILYIPDGNVMGTVKSISAVQDFSHSVDAKGAAPGMNLVAEAECDIPEYTLVNSRKLNVRTKISMNIKVTSASEVHVSTGIEGTDDIQTNTAPLKICNSGCDADRDIIIRERLEVPSGKPDPAEILRLSAKPVSNELRLLDNKAIVKGELKLSTLYCSSDEENSIHCMEHSVPFTDILEVEGLSENMTGEVDYSVKDIYFEICRDADGDKRILSTEITLCACIRASEIIECNAVCDAYSLKKAVKLEKSLCNMEQLIDSMRTQLTQKEQISVPDYLPDVYQICDCTAVPCIEGITAENGTACVNGYTTCSILYMTGDKDTPISGFSHVFPFSHTFDIPNLTESSLCDAKADSEHLSFTISGPRSVDIRTIISLSLKAVNPDTCEIISEIDYDDTAETPSAPSIVICFVQKDDTLWSIAKRYRTTTDAILSANGSEKECLKPGNKIYIFR